MANTEEFIEYVYYYPPYLDPSNINSITLDNYGMVAINYTLTLAQQVAQPTTINDPVVGIFEWALGETVNLNMTPQAYVNWYNNNKSSISSSNNNTLLTNFYNQMISPTGNYPNQQAATSAANYAAGYQFIPFSQYNSSGKAVITDAILHGFLEANQSELYAMVNPNANNTNIAGNIAANVPWYIYAIFGIAGVIILISMLYNMNIFKASGEMVAVGKAITPHRHKEEPPKGPEPPKESHQVIEYRHTYPTKNNTEPKPSKKVERIKGEKVD